LPEFYLLENKKKTNWNNEQYLSHHIPTTSLKASTHIDTMQDSSQKEVWPSLICQGFHFSARTSDSQCFICRGKNASSGPNVAYIQHHSLQHSLKHALTAEASSTVAEDGCQSILSQGDGTASQHSLGLSPLPLLHPVTDADTQRDAQLSAGASTADPLGHNGLLPGFVWSFLCCRRPYHRQQEGLPQDYAAKPMVLTGQPHSHALDEFPVWTAEHRVPSTAKFRLGAVRAALAACWSAPRPTLAIPAGYTRADSPSTTSANCIRKGGLWGREQGRHQEKGQGQRLLHPKTSEAVPQVSFDVRTVQPPLRSAALFRNTQRRVLSTFTFRSHDSKPPAANPAETFPTQKRDYASAGTGHAVSSRPSSEGWKVFKHPVTCLC